MDRYKKVKVIGKGAFGAAILVQPRSDPRQHLVIKQVDVSRMKQKEREEAKKEIKLLASFKHPNIVHYRDSLLEGGQLYIVMARHGVPTQTKKDGSCYFCIDAFDPDRCVWRKDKCPSR